MPLYLHGWDELDNLYTHVAAAMFRIEAGIQKWIRKTQPVRVQLINGCHPTPQVAPVKVITGYFSREDFDHLGKKKILLVSTP